MKSLKPEKFYLNGFTGEIKQGKDWDWIEFDQLTELVWVGDDFEYAKDSFLEV